MSTMGDGSAADAAEFPVLARGATAFFVGVGTVLSGFGRIVRDRRLRGLAVTPVAITMVCYLLVAVTAGVFTPDLLDSIWARPADGWMVWVWYVLVPIIFLALLVVVSLVFVSLAGVVAGPFYEKMVTVVLAEHGRTAEDVGLVKGTGYELVRAVVYVVPAVVCTLIGLVPGIGLPFVVAGTAIGWVGLASTALNPALIATGAPLGEQLRYPWRSMAAMLGVGAVVGLSLMVPLLGLISIPSAVVGTTDLYAKRLAGR